MNKIHYLNCKILIDYSSPLSIIRRIHWIVPFYSQYAKENHICPKYPKSSFIAKDGPRKNPSNDENECQTWNEIHDSTKLSYVISLFLVIVHKPVPGQSDIQFVYDIDHCSQEESEPQVNHWIWVT